MRRCWFYRVLLVFVILYGINARVEAVRAQDDETPESLVEYGQIVTSALGSSVPSERHIFEGLRCEAISIQVRVTSGNLDPVVVLLDNDGNVLAAQDDSLDSVDVLIEQVRLPVTARYTIVVARFGYGLGSTSGGYELRIDRIGPGSSSRCALRYGDTILYNISNDEPEVYYSFYAAEGDIINITMRRRSGNLDPYLQVVQVTGTSALVIGFSDDTLGSLDAHIEGLLIPASGTYIIIATRYGQEAGLSTGNFILSLEEAANSGMGNSPQAAIPISLGATVEGEITADAFTRYYRFEARQDDLVTLRMSRMSGSLDAYLILTNAGLQELAANDDANQSQNSEIPEYRIPATGTYYIVATRYRQEAGASTGRFRLQLEYLGNAFDGVPPNVQRISYGLSVTGSIDDVTPEVLYAFYGVEGDVITVSMNRGSGDLDPVVSILNEDLRVLASNDDAASGNPNARIERFAIPATGVYYIRAGRFAAPESALTSGSYILVLAQRFD